MRRQDFIDLLCGLGCLGILGLIILASARSAERQIQNFDQQLQQQVGQPQPQPGVYK